MEEKRMTRDIKDIIADMREIVKPCIAQMLFNENFEGKGNTDKAEFETEFEMLLTLAERGATVESQGDLISREAVLNLVLPWCADDDGSVGKMGDLREVLDDIENLHSAEPQEWIPIKTRPLTKEEKEHYAEMGYSDDSVTFMYDCPLPDDGEEVLVTDWLGNVEFDTFIRDECDGCYFEENCDDGEVVAWKHKPSPYKGDTE
jgi:hypothetical protein